MGRALAEKASWRQSIWVNLQTCGIAFGLLLDFLEVHNLRTRIADGLKAILVWQPVDTRSHCHAITEPYNSAVQCFLRLLLRSSALSFLAH